MSSRSSNSPPAFPGLYCVGWIKSAHGIRGEIYIQLYAERADWLPSARSFGLSSKGGEPRSFKIERAKPHKEGLIAKLEGVSTRNDSEALAKSLVYIDESLLTSTPEEGVFLRQIEGFEVADPKGERLGQIIGFASNGPQDLLRLKRQDGAPEALVPFVDAFLVNIDFDNKQVTMDLPPGLLSLEEE